MTDGTDGFHGDERSSVILSDGRCMWPLIRRNRLPPRPCGRRTSAGARLSFCQFFTFLEWLRQMEIIDSMLLVLRSVRASVGDTPRRRTARLSVGHSHRLPAAPGCVRFNSRANTSNLASVMIADCV